MTRLAKTLWLPAALSVGLMFIGASAFAGGEYCDPKYEKCPPKVTADCSPGYYKNHPEEWCSTYVGSGSPSDPAYPGSGLSRDCASGNTCTLLINNVSAELGASKEQREGVKAILDACFETAEESPCEDDD
jgi:hypothetical protein